MMYLARHGVAAWGVDDPGLSDLGQAQAEALGETCMRLGVALIRTSPLKRARETAARIAPPCGAAVLQDLRLVEFDQTQVREEWELRQRATWSADAPLHHGELWVSHGGVLNEIWWAWRLPVPHRGPIDRHGSLVACGELWSVRPGYAERVHP